MSDLPPPPPPPPEGYPISGGGSSLSVGQALSKGWESFVKRWVDFLIIAVIVGVIAVVFSWLLVRDNYNAGRLLLWSFISLALAVLASLWQTMVALAAVDGDERPFGTLVSEAMGKLGAYLGWTIVAGLIVFVGLVLCVLPGILAAFFLMFVPFLAIEMRRQGNPLSDSFNAVKQEAGNLILVFLVFLGLAIVASIISSILNFIPLIGGIAGSIIQFLLFGFTICTLAGIYRASAIGRINAA